MQISKIIEEQVEQIKKEFTCINPSCDGNGSIPVQVYDGEWEAEQCEFCFVKRFPVFKSILSSHIAVLQAELERKKGMMIPELPENIHMGRWKDTAHEGWNKSIQEDITYLENEITKIKEL